MTFKHILVPVDFSANASEALAMAAELSRRFDARISLLHVFQPVSYAMPEGYMLYTPKQLAELLTAFEAQLASAKAEAERAGAVTVRTDQVQGVPAVEITEYAEKERCDLIVMGTHGRTGLQRALLGSVTEQVLRHAACPVLTVRMSDRKRT